MMLTRSDSRSTTASNGEGGIDELCQLFAAGHVDPIVQGLLSMRAALTRDSPDTVHTVFCDSLPEMLAAASCPFALVLQLLNEPALAQRGAAAGGKVDLRTLLARALRSVCTSERMHSTSLEPATSAQAATPLPTDLTPELTAQARAMLLRLPPFLNPRAFEAVKSLYRVELSPRDLFAYARACYDAGNYRDAAEFLKAFNLTADEPSADETRQGASPLDGFPHAALLLRLASDKANMDVFIAYLSQSPAFLAKHVKAALTQLAEVSGGNDANLAAKLAGRFGLPLTDIPRVRYLKIKDLIWWISRIGKAMDFGVELAGNDSGLQRKLLRELSRSKSHADRLTACSFMELWPQQEYRDFYSAHAQLRREQIASQTVPPTAEEIVMADLQRAISLWQEQQQQREAGAQLPADGSLFLPALAAAVSPSSSSPPDLPQLFLHPSSIVIVDSLESLSVARAHLLDPRTTVIGLDLEHLPENFVGLNLRPTLCQWLQIACDTRAFLFDLQRMHKPTKQEIAEAAATAAAEAKAAAAAPCGGGVIRNGMRVLSSASSPSPASPLVRLFPVPPSTSCAPPPFDPLFRDGVNDLLLSLFTNDAVLKVGIGFAQDMRKLRLDFGPEVSSEAAVDEAEHAADHAASAPCDECEVDNGCIAFQITLQNYVGLEPLLKLVADPDAEQREGQRRKQAQEAKRKAAEKRKTQKKGQAGAGAAAAAASPSPPAAKQGGLSALFGGGDDDDADDDDAAEPSAATGMEADDAASAAASAVAASPLPPAAAAPVVAASSSSAVSSSSAPSVARSVGGGYTHQAKKEGGLSKLVRMMLRRTLDKSEQISNWARRPISENQTQYAALDAYVCVKLMQEARSQGIDLESENIECGAL